MRTYLQSLLKFLNKYFLVIILVLYIILGLPLKNGHSTYAYNELLRDLHVEKQLAQGDLLVQGPVSSLGSFHFGPIYYYLILPIVALSGYKLYSLALSSMLFFAATIALNYYILCRWFKDKKIAQISSFLMALSFLSFHISKYGSNPNPVPFFTLLFFYGLYKLMQKEKTLAGILIFSLAFGIVTQLHAVPLLVFSLIVIWIIYKKYLNFSKWIIFCLVNLILYMPYLLVNIKTHFVDLFSLVLINSYAHKQLLQFFISHIASYLTFWLSPFIFLDPFFNSMTYANSLMLICGAILIAIIAPLYRYNHPRRKVHFISIEIDSNLKKMLKLWFIVPTAVLLLSPQISRDFPYYYFFCLLPLVFLFFALLLVYTLRRGLHLLFYYMIILFLIFQFTQMYLYIKLIKDLNL